MHLYEFDNNLDRTPPRCSLCMHSLKGQSALRGRGMATLSSRAGRKGIIPNLPHNNVSELFGMFIHKRCE
jgi:hypothetical protein